MPPVSPRAASVSLRAVRVRNEGISICRRQPGCHRLAPSSVVMVQFADALYLQLESGSIIMAARKSSPPVPILRIKKGDSLKTIYAKARKAFTAADLQKYTEIEEGIPARQLLAELEAIDREQKAKRKKRKPKNGRSR